MDVICFPTTEDPALVLFNDRVGMPAAISRVEAYELSELPPAPVVVPPDGGRDIGLYAEHFPTILLSFGSGIANFDTEPENWQAAAERLSSYMRFTGQNLFVGVVYFFHWCTYPSALFGCSYTDWPQIILDQFEQDGLRLLPQIYLRWTHLWGEAPTPEAIADGADTCACVRADGTVQISEDQPAAEASDPRVRDLLGKAVQELVDRYGDEPAFAGLSLLVGKGLANSYATIRDGYGDGTIERFTRDTGIRVPVDETGGRPADRFRQRSEWLTTNAKGRTGCQPVPTGRPPHKGRVAELAQRAHRGAQRRAVPHRDREASGAGVPPQLPRAARPRVCELVHG